MTTNNTRVPGQNAPVEQFPGSSPISTGGTEEGIDQEDLFSTPNLLKETPDEHAQSDIPSPTGAIADTTNVHETNSSTFSPPRRKGRAKGKSTTSAPTPTGMVTETPESAQPFPPGGRTSEILYRERRELIDIVIRENMLSTFSAPRAIDLDAVLAAVKASPRKYPDLYELLYGVRGHRTVLGRVLAKILDRKSRVTLVYEGLRLCLRHRDGTPARYYAERME